MLAPIRGTNKYWFRVKGEVKAMIAEYGSPTLFSTLSCAKYDSADIAQYLRKDFLNIVILQRGVLGKVEQYLKRISNAWSASLSHPPMD
uniref:Uncharacterized protein n=1 Tax=Amphimedon queenslandica TaxID=400682 RepID=A0A1X7U2U3_AMPQE